MNALIDEITADLGARVKAKLAAWSRIAGMGRWINLLLGGKSAYFRPLFDATRLSALHGRLEVVRDANGVAHLYADNEADLYVALGFMQASERGLHLDFLRHLARGQLSGWITGVRLPESMRVLPGFSLVDVDKFVRPLGFVDEANLAIARMSARSLLCLQAFAQGVNDAWGSGLCSPEQLLLAKSEPWTPVDCLLAARACALVIALLPLENELVFDNVRAELGDELARLLYPEAPWENVPDLKTRGALSGVEVPLDPLSMGSNNWAVAGARTKSGKPLLANDPHVPLLPAPTFWHHVHLCCPAYDVQGGMYPGFPAFGFGHNARLGWGVTTAFRDAWDLFRIERLAGAASRYHTADGVGALTSHSEPLHKRFAKEDIIEWEQCEHGIVYPDWKHADGTDLALKYVDCDHVAHWDGHLALMAAQTPAELDAALAKINEGPFDFNVVHAHAEGRIGWHVVGRLPNRARDGLFVRNASDAGAQWRGYRPFADNPSLIQPECGFVATANSVVDATQHGRLGTWVHCEVDYRQKRVESWLGASTQHTLADMQRMQADVDSDFSRPLRDALCVLLAPYRQATPQLRDALQALEQWNGVFDSASVGACVFSLVRRTLPRVVFGKLLSEKLARRFAHGQRAIPRLDRLLLDELDPLRQLLLEKTEYPLAHWVGVAFENTVEKLSRQFGESVPRWRWGRIQTVRIATALAEVVPGATPFVALEAEFPGEANTLSPAVSMKSGECGLRVFNGASSRFIVDFATPSEAWFAHSCGPSADPETPFFRQQSEQWAKFRWFKSGLWSADQVPDVVERVIVRGSDLVELRAQDK